MWHLSLPWWEFVLRGLVVYLFLILILRLTGKRQIGQMSPFDLVLLLVLSNAVQNSMHGGDNSLAAGLILAVTLVGLNWLTGLLTYKSKTAERLIEGSPQVLLHNGKIYEKSLHDAQLSRDELMSALRSEGFSNFGDVRAAILENDGSISVIPHHNRPS
jgi:uncharacterized membrane protein YcaP (DUF421 family)